MVRLRFTRDAKPRQPDTGEIDAPHSGSPIERASHGDGGMATMRIAAITMVGALALSTSAIAQDTATSNTQKVAQYSTDNLTSELNLTADQVPKVQKVNVASAEAMKKLLQKYGSDTSMASTQALAKGMVAEIRANQTALKKILTPAQWTLHQQHKAERLAQTQTEIMASELNLTRQQILDVSRINMEGANQLVAALDKPLAGNKPTHQAIREAAKPAMEARDAALHNVLTVDQWKKVQQKRLALQELFVQEASASPNPSAAAAAPRPKP